MKKPLLMGKEGSGTATPTLRLAKINVMYGVYFI
jgi:hypothetical protein